MQSTLKKIFQDLRQHPGWNVHRGYGSFVTFEFGKPHLKNCGLIKRRGKKPFPKKSRLVYARGDWHLWIYCCNWAVSQDGKHVAHSESSHEEIDRACGFLRGQKIRGIGITPKTGKTVFSFDLGGAMKTWPWPEKGEAIEQWSLYCPNNRLFLFRSDGCFHYGRLSSSKSKDRVEYLPVKEDLVSVGLPPLYPSPRWTKKNSR